MCKLPLHSSVKHYTLDCLEPRSLLAELNKRIVQTLSPGSPCVSHRPHTTHNIQVIIHFIDALNYCTQCLKKKRDCLEQTKPEWCLCLKSGFLSH